MKRLLSLVMALMMVASIVCAEELPVVMPAEAAVVVEEMVPAVEAGVVEEVIPAVLEDAPAVEELPTTSVDAAVEEAIIEVPAAVEAVVEPVALEVIPSWVVGYYQIPAGTVIYQDGWSQNAYGKLAESAVGYANLTENGRAYVTLNLNDAFVVARVTESALSKIQDEAYLAQAQNAKTENGISLKRVVFVDETPAAAAQDAFAVVTAPDADVELEEIPVATGPVAAASYEEPAQNVAQNSKPSEKTVAAEAAPADTVIPGVIADVAEMVLMIPVVGNDSGNDAPATDENEPEPETPVSDSEREEISVVIAEASIDEVMAEFEMDGTKLIRYLGKSTNLVIPNDPTRITAIGEFAFTEASTLVSVSIPDTITSIETGAFNNCVNLQTVSLPSTLTQIPDQLFKGCTNLQTISLPSGITKIGDRAFESCTSIKNLVLPSNLTTIGKYAFWHDTSLTDMGYPFSLTSIGDHAFEGCTGMNTINLNEGLLEVKDYAFADCTNTTSLTLPSTLQEIGSYAFYNDSGLTKIKVPAAVAKIGAYAFNGINSEATVIVYNPVVIIGNHAFSNIALIVGYYVSTTHHYANGYAMPLFCSIETWNFVANAYGQLFNRFGTDEEIIHWCKTLQRFESNGAALIVEMVRSAGFINRNLANKDIVNALYISMLYRVPDSEAETLYTNALDDHVSILYVIDQITKSVEYTNKCAALYYIAPGSVTITEARDLDIRVTRLVDRMYRLILQREPDVNGLNSWCYDLLKGTRLGATIVNDFVMSPEFQNRALTNEQMIEILYNALLDRASDPEGKNNWKTILDGGCSIQYIANGFCVSPEFRNICLTAGIRPGSIILEQPRDRNPLLTAFVTRCYTVALLRNPDLFGLNNWCSWLLTGKVTPQEVAKHFLFSVEAKNMNWNDTEFVEQLYHLYMNRPSDPPGLATWLGRIESHIMTRVQVADDFTKSAEFQAILKSYGL